MNVPMYLRDEERELDRVLEEKEERWRREEPERMQEKKYEAMKQQMMQNAGMTNHGVYGAAVSGHSMLLRQLGTSGLTGKIGQHTQPLSLDPNTMPEMQMSLEVAYNMWLVRFGDMWVKSEDVQDADGFRWPLVASRLRDMRLMEVTTVSNHYRLVPHVWT